MIAGSGGSVSPGSGWHDAGQSVQITAMNQGFCTFQSWSGSGPGSYTGTANPVTIVMNGPITEEAHFFCSTPTATPTCLPGYTPLPAAGTLTPATTDIDASCDDCLTPITLPFPVTLFSTSFTSAKVDSNGVFSFNYAYSTFANTCLPGSDYGDAIFAHWDDLRTDTGAGCASYPGGTCGIFTAVTGSAPFRTFVTEWRAVYFDDPASTLNFEVMLHENSSSFEVIYGTLGHGGTSATAGVQGGGSMAHLTQFACNTSLPNNTRVSYILETCGTPSYTPTPTPTASPTCTPPAAVLWDQTNSAGTTATTSQNFEAAYDRFDAEVADDFEVPSGSFWNITHIDVSGQYFSGAGPADSVNVVFYNGGNLPINPVCTYNNVPIASGADTGQFEHRSANGLLTGSRTILGIGTGEHELYAERAVGMDGPYRAGEHRRGISQSRTAPFSVLAIGCERLRVSGAMHLIRYSNSSERPAYHVKHRRERRHRHRRLQIQQRRHRPQLAA